MGRRELIITLIHMWLSLFFVETIRTMIAAEYDYDLGLEMTEINRFLSASRTSREEDALASTFSDVHQRPPAVPTSGD